MGISNDNLSNINVEMGEPTLVPPAQDTSKKGSLYFLSNIDLKFQAKVRTVYCFKPSGNGGGGGGGGGGDDVAKVIKEALSKVLVLYYPAAGRLTMDSDGRPVVHCTDDGAVFVEAKADCTIEEIGNDTVAMERLVYDTPSAKHLLEVPPLAAQVTTFKNGGFVLGICVNHFIFDGATAMQFINHWGEIARGLSLKVPRFLDRTILRARNPPQIEFPHTEFSDIEDVSNTNDLYTEEMLYKSFSFDLLKLEKLKSVAMEDGVLAKCSTFEVLSAFIWRSRTRALKMRHDQKVKLQLVVDGRSRFDPPLPEHYFGNGVALTSCHSTAGELTEKPLSFAVRLIREAIQRVTDRYMKSAIDYLEVNGGNVCMNATLLISSWTRLSFETTDFGWGQPYLAGRTSLPVKELALFLSHPTDKTSINVLLSFPTSSMKIFQELMQI